MTLHLVRHAAAGQRDLFRGDDLQRPLSAKGKTQACALVDFFTGTAIRGIRSSMATRCVETVEPLARDRGLSVETTHALTEGAPGDELWEILLAEARNDGDLVLCSHGDLIPLVLSRLMLSGMLLKGPQGCAKGSVWSLNVDFGAITSAHYVADPASTTRMPQRHV